MAIDEGTTNCKTVLVSKSGRLVSSGSSTVPISYPKPSWVEQDVNKIWQSTLESIENCLATEIDFEIIALGISNQRESILIWDRSTGEPLSPVITWQCRRSAELCNELKIAGNESKVISITGLPLDPMFPATKLKWILDNILSDHKIENVCAGTVDSWLIWKLTDGKVHATDCSNASRTQLLNIANGSWDESLCTLFGIPTSILPNVSDSSNIFGNTENVPMVPNGIPIASAIGDSHAALFGSGANEIGDSKITFGTGSSMMTTIPHYMESPQGITTTIAWSINGQITYALEGNILVSASILPWTAKILGIKDVDMLLELAQTVDTSLGVSLVPAHVGLGSPHWNSDARGLICGLTFSTDTAHIARAAAESIALQVFDIYSVMLKSEIKGIKRLFVNGGPSENLFLMKLVADILDHSLLIARESEISACGAAYLAGLTVGFWDKTRDIEALNSPKDEIFPEIDDTARYSILDSWNTALGRVKFKSEN